MHGRISAAHVYAYEPDTRVVDVGDLTVQMQDDSGTWHRRAIGGNTTACGVKIDHRLQQEIRHEAYDGKICRAGCFSYFEIALSDQANREQKKEDQR